MKEYHKIPTIYKRDVTGSMKLIEGDFTDKTFCYLKDCQWQFTEKIDGTNIRVYWDGHKIYLGGRTDKADIPQELKVMLWDKFIDKTSNSEELFEQLFGEKEVILFGEGYGAKIQNGGDYRRDCSFILFDVLVGDIYLNRQACEEIAGAFGIEIVPIVCEGTLEDGVIYVKTHSKSTLGTAFMEGVVGRPLVELKNNQGERVIVKIKYRDFQKE
jgi:hypothetical protein